MDVLLLLAAGLATALATGLGAPPVFLLGPRAAALRPALVGLAVGLMGVASIVGLLMPALEDASVVTVVAGTAAGVLFLLGTDRLLAGHDLRFGELHGVGGRQSVLVFAVLFVHSLPEGMAMGTAYTSEREGLGLFVILAIALQNVPEGTSVAIPMAGAGFGRGAMFWAAVVTSAPQPLAAPLAYLAVEEVEGLLPFSFAFRGRGDARARRGQARARRVRPQKVAARLSRDRRGGRAHARPELVAGGVRVGRGNGRRPP